MNEQRSEYEPCKRCISAMRVLGSKYMKITIIGYKNHALRLKSILNKLGYDNVVNYNHHTDSLEDSDVFYPEQGMDVLMKLANNKSEVLDVKVFYPMLHHLEIK